MDASVKKDIELRLQVYCELKTCLRDNLKTLKTLSGHGDTEADDLGERIMNEL